jgi:hypothetical protein
MTKEQLRDEVEAAKPLIDEGKRALVGGRACYTEEDVFEAVTGAISFYKIEGIDLSDEGDESEDTTDQTSIVAALEARIKELEAQVLTPAAPETLGNRAKEPEAEEKPAAKSRKKPEAPADETSEEKTTDQTPTEKAEGE